MKKIFFPAALAIVMAFAATDASAQQKIGPTSSSDRPMPTNSEITGSKDQAVTNGKPFEQIRVNETDSPRNRENMEIITNDPIERASDSDPAQRVNLDKERRREEMSK